MTSQPDERLLVEVEDGIAVLTLNRPERRNALDHPLRSALRSTLADLDADDAVEVMVLTGADPAFCAGVDLTSQPSPSPQEGPPWPESRRTPLVGAVNGPAITGGLELALWCDVIVASEKAWFADTHAAVGAVPFWGLTSRLPRAVGKGKALEMSLFGTRIGADEAVRLGLANVMVPHQDLLPTAREFATRAKGTDRKAAAAVLAQYEAVAEAPPGEALGVERSYAERFFEGAGALHGTDRLAAGRARSTPA